MSEEKSVPVFHSGEGGEQIQVGKSTPAVDGVRNIKLFKKYEGLSKKDLAFGDDETLPAEPIQETPDASLAAKPVEDAVGTPSDTEWVDATPDVPLEEIDEDDVDDVEELPEDLEPASAVYSDGNNDQ